MEKRKRPSRGPSFTDVALSGTLTVEPGTAFERCTFRGVNLQEADLSRCRFVECRFDACNLSVASVTECVLQDVRFRDCKLAGIDWSGTRRFSVVAFEACVLDQCAFMGMDLKKAVLRDCRLREVVFAETDLSEADVRAADLTGARFSGTKLAKADLRGAHGYVIHPLENGVAGLRVSMPDAVGLVTGLGVEVES